MQIVCIIRAIKARNLYYQEHATHTPNHVLIEDVNPNQIISALLLLNEVAADCAEYLNATDSNVDHIKTDEEVDRTSTIVD